MNLCTRHAGRLLAVVCLALLCTFAAWAQMATETKQPGTATVSIYRVAPGKHLDFMKWMAAREAAAKEAGAPAVQWYAHMDGDSWDYLAIAPESTDAMDDKVDAILKSKGLTTGFKGGLELRTMMASHTDTFARGPVTAADMVEWATK
jgi:uncharacterized protein (DUF1800 family)